MPLLRPLSRADVAINRRSLLQVGALSGIGLTLADLICSRALAGNGSAPSGELDRAVIQVYLAGGPSHYETFDPKPQAAAEIRGPYAPIATNAPGMFVCETLPRLAQVADRFSLLRSCCHENSGHGGAHRHIHTGYVSASPEFELPHDFPVVGSVVAKVRGPMRRGLPTFMQAGNSGDGEAAFLGPAYNSFQVYSTGKPVGLEIHPYHKVERLDDRRRLRADLDRLARAAVAPTLDAIDNLDQQAYDMLTSTAAHEAFDVQKEPEATRAAYGDHDAGRCALLARRFVEAGAGFVTLRMGSWDHHGNAGGTITSGIQDNGPPMDQAVSALIADLHDRGLSERVLVVVWGEFGRTPRINSSSGRDHWPQAMSILFSGGGLRMGQVVGETTRNGERPVADPYSPEDVLATLYKHLRIDPSQAFLNARGRPIPILTDGKAIAALG